MLLVFTSILFVLIPILTGAVEHLCELQLQSCAPGVTTLSAAEYYCGPDVYKCKFPDQITMNLGGTVVAGPSLCCAGGFCCFADESTQDSHGCADSQTHEDACKQIAAAGGGGGTTTTTTTTTTTVAPAPGTTTTTTTTTTIPPITPGQLQSLVGLTTEEDGIAWIKAFTCTNTVSYVYEAPFNDENGFIEYAKYATSIKFVTPNGGGISIYAQECNNQVLSMNNGYDMSFQTDANNKITGYSKTSEWVGNTQYTSNSCYPGTGVGQYPRPLGDSIFHACNNGPGLHLIPANNNCAVNGQTVIDVYLGFDDQLQNDCAGNPIPFAPTNSRDCSVLAIDEFLLQCSTEFPTAQQQVSDLEVRLDALETNLQGQVDTNTANIQQLQTDINNGGANTAAEIQQLQTDIDDVNARIDLFAAKTPGNMNVIGENNGNNNGFSVSDGAILILLLANFITMSYIYCWKNNKGVKNKKRGYVVPIDEDSDVEQIDNVKI